MRQLFLCATIILAGLACDQPPSADQIQQAQQERILQDLGAQCGMPAIKNARERKLLKQILEMRDQEGLVTYTYAWSEMQGKYRFLGESIGFGVPYATQYTSPSKWEWFTNQGWRQSPQADPNGLFSPATAEGTWVLLKDPHGEKVLPVYFENRICVSPFKLRDSAVFTD